MQSLVSAPAECQEVQTLETVPAASLDCTECSILCNPTLIHEHPATFPASLPEKKNGHRRAEVFPNHEAHSVFSSAAQLILMRFLQRAAVDTPCFYKEPCNLHHLNFNYPISLVPQKAVHGNYTESYFSNSIIQILPSFS